MNFNEKLQYLIKHILSEYSPRNQLKGSSKRRLELFVDAWTHPHFLGEIPPNGEKALRQESVGL